MQTHTHTARAWIKCSNIQSFDDCNGLCCCIFSCLFEHKHRMACEGSILNFSLQHFPPHPDTHFLRVRFFLPLCGITQFSIASGATMMTMHLWQSSLGQINKIYTGWIRLNFDALQWFCRLVCRRWTREWLNINSFAATPTTKWVFLYWYEMVVGGHVSGGSAQNWCSKCAK